MADVEVAEDRSTPGAWRVEDHDSGELAVFAGPGAEDRARGYAEYQYNHYTDGTINREYFVIEGYARDNAAFPTDAAGDPEMASAGPLEGYWRNR